MRTIFAIFISLYCYLPLNAQSLSQLPLDSLIQWVSDNAYGIYENENVEEVHHYAFICLTRAKEQAKVPTIVAACQNLALLHYLIEDRNVPDSALFYDQMALDYLLKTDDKTAIAKAYNYVAGDYQDWDDYDNAQANYLKSLELYKDLDNQKGMAKVYSDLSLLY